MPAGGAGLLRGPRVAVLVGGHDRGLTGRTSPKRCARTRRWRSSRWAQNGPRIHALLAADRRAAAGFALIAATDLAEAMALARERLLRRRRSPVILLSPGAPSFGAYRDYAERGRHFAELAGFDPDAISAIPGLGIA